jgi:ABC-type phosphate transport system substrate-binding protein
MATMTPRHLIACCAASLLPTLSAAGDIYIIANPSVRLTPEEAREVFLGEKQLAGSVKLVPFDNASVQSEFLEKVYRIDVAKYNTLWAKKGFRDGLNPPAVKGTDVEVIASVKATPGAVGYVSTTPSGVTVIRKY